MFKKYLSLWCVMALLLSGVANAEYIMTTNSGTDDLNLFGALFNLDKTNNRVGIGTTAPGERLSLKAGTADNSAVFGIYNSSNVLGAKFTDQGRLIYGTAANASWEDRVDGALHLHAGKKLVLTDGANSLSEIYADGKYIRLSALDTSGGLYLDGGDIYLRNNAGTNYMTRLNSHSYWDVYSDFKLRTGFSYGLGIGTFERNAKTLGAYMSDNHEGTSIGLFTDTGEQGLPTAYDSIQRMWLSTQGNIGFNGSAPTELFEVHQDATSYRRITVATNLTTVTHDQTVSNFDFTKEFVVGETIDIGGESHTISTIDSATSMTISPAHTASGNFAYTRSDYGTRFLIKKNTGFVGINKTDPAERLDVAGAIVLDAHEAATPVAGTMEWDGTNFRGYDGSGWTELDTGTPDTVMFDATVGTGGDYATVGAALTAGHRILKLVSDVTETADIAAPTEYFEINLNTYDWDLDTYGVTSITDSLKVYNGSITYAYSASRFAFAATNEEDMRFSNVIVNNNSTANLTAFSRYGTYVSCTFNLPNQEHAGLGHNPNYFVGRTYDTEFVGGGTSCNRGIFTNGAAAESVHKNLKISGTWSTTGDGVIYIWGSNKSVVDGLIYTGTGNANAFAYNMRNVDDSNRYLSLRGVYIEDSQARTINPANLLVARGCSLTTGFTITTDNVSVVDTAISGGTITVHENADNTSLIAVRGSSSIVDNGTNTNIWANGEIKVSELVELSQATAPTTTTDKLYNVSGDLFWDGALLGGVPSRIEDTATTSYMEFGTSGADTFVTTKTASTTGTDSIQNWYNGSDVLAAKVEVDGSFTSYLTANTDRYTEIKGNEIYLNSVGAAASDPNIIYGDGGGYLRFPTANNSQWFFLQSGDADDIMQMTASSGDGIDIDEHAIRRIGEGNGNLMSWFGGSPVTKGALSINTGTPNYVGGIDLNLYGGPGNNAGSGDVNIYGGDSNTGSTDSDGGNIALYPGTGAGTGSDGAIVIGQTTAPTTTTDKLYNVGGTLTWNGTALGGDSTGILDGDTDTWITVEETADADTIVARANQTGTATLLETRDSSDAVRHTFRADGSASWATQYLSQLQGISSNQIRTSGLRMYSSDNSAYSYILFGANTTNSPIDIFARGGLKLGQVVSSAYMEFQQKSVDPNVGLWNTFNFVQVDTRETAIIADRIVGGLSNSTADLRLRSAWTTGLTTTNTYIDGGDSSNVSAVKGDVLLQTETTGNVGIGETSPAEKLHVSGAAIVGAHENATPVAGTIEWDTTNFRGYDGSGWVNLDTQGSSGISIGDAVTSSTAGSVLFADGSGDLGQDNANLFWDDTNDRLGIGIATPNQELEVQGDIRATSTTGNQYVNIDPETRSINFFNQGVSSKTMTVGTSFSFDAPLVTTNSFNVGTAATSLLDGKLVLGKSGGVNMFHFIAPGSYDQGVLGYNGGDDLVYRVRASSMTNGTELFRITGSGNVGIRTAAPSATLHTKSGLNTALTGSVSVTAGTAAVTGVSTSFTTQLSVGDLIKIADEVFAVASITDATHLTLDTNHSAGASNIGAYRDGDLFRVDNGEGTERFSIDQSGIVGLSQVTAPSITTDKLYNVAGDLYWNGSALATGSTGISIGDAVTSSTAGSILFADGTGDLGQDNANLFWDDTNDRLGIGTTSPAAKLHSQATLGEELTGTVSVSASSPTVTGTSTSFDTELGVGSAIEIAGEVFTVVSIGSATSLMLDSNHIAGATGVTAYTDSTLLRVDSGDGVEKFTIANSGNVGIGTSDPAHLLDIEVDTGATPTVHIKNMEASGGGGEALLVESQRGSATGDVAVLEVRNNSDSLLYVRNDGNVGIGTTSPAGTLHVYKDSPVINDRLITIGSSDDSEIFFVNSQGNAQLDGYFQPGGGVQMPSGGDVYWGNSEIKGYNDSDILFTTNGSEAMRIKDGGNIGIGTDAPNNALDVVGQIVARQATDLTPTGTTQTIDFDNGNAQVLDLSSATGDVTLTLSNTYAGGSYLVKVEQGATVRDLIWPASVKWPEGAGFVLSSTANATDVVSLYYDGTDYLASVIRDFRTNASLPSASASDFLSLTDTPSAYTAGSLLFTSGSAVTEDNTNLFWDDSNNRLGVGTASPAVAVDVAGAVTATGTMTANAFSQSSDRNLKENIVPLESSLENVKKMQGVEFTWKDSGEKSLGFIAQEMENIYPELVDDNANGYKSLQYSNLSAVLVEALKELDKKVEVQDELIEALREEVLRLKMND